MTPTISLEVRGGETKSFTGLLLDYTGTLSLDGTLLPGVAQRLVQLARTIRITVLTADTFGKPPRLIASPTRSLCFGKSCASRMLASPSSIHDAGHTTRRPNGWPS